MRHCLSDVHRDGPICALEPTRLAAYILGHEFRLEPISKPRGWLDAITVFRRSLTEDWNGQLIAVIVSGYDGDGAAALCGIKDVGGITIAQALETALQPDMPESAIASGCIDFVLSPEEIALKIAGIARGELSNGSETTEPFWFFLPLSPTPLPRGERG